MTYTYFNHYQNLANSQGRYSNSTSVFHSFSVRYHIKKGSNYRLSVNLTIKNNIVTQRHNFFKCELDQVLYRIYSVLVEINILTKRHSTYEDILFNRWKLCLLANH